MQASLEALSADKEILEERLANEKVCEIISGAYYYNYYTTVR